jgi:carboxymethylenebutenolidase
MITFSAGEETAAGYLAIPQVGQGPGVLVLHAWWGLNDFFKSLCDRLAQAGFVAFAPDLYQGRTAQTVDEAKQLMEDHFDFATMRTIALAAADWLSERSEVQSRGLGAIGFSMGASWAILLSGAVPETITAAVIFYGAQTIDFTTTHAAYLGHFAEVDEWEPLDGVRQMEVDMQAAGREVTLHFYTDVGHWFFESNRPDAYDPEAAQLAWERTVDFLNGHLTKR